MTVPSLNGVKWDQEDLFPTFENLFWDSFIIFHSFVSLNPPLSLPPSLFPPSLSFSAHLSPKWSRSSYPFLVQLIRVTASLLLTWGH